MALSRKPIEIVEQENHQLLTKAEHWERVFLADIAQVQNGFAFKSEWFTSADGMPLIRIRDIENGHTENYYSGEYSQEYVVRNGNILIGMDGDFNAAIWRGADGLLNQRVCRITPTTELFSEKFLFLCLQPYLNAINAETSSVTVKHLSSKTIGEIPLPLPPLNEQHRIVAQIEELFSELDKGIENLRTAREQLKVYRQALLKHAFEGKLTTAWRAANPDKLEPAAALLARVQTEREQRYQQQLQQWQTHGGNKPIAPKPLPPLTAEELAELPKLPEGWGWVKLGDLATKITDGEHFKPPVKTEGVYFLSAKDVRDDGVSFDDPLFIDQETANKARSRCDPERGDLLIVSRGATVGRMCTVSTDKLFCLLGSVILIKATSAVGSAYFLSALKSPFVNKRIVGVSGATAQQAIYLRDIQHIPVPVCTLAEQAKLVNELESKLSEADQLDQTLTTSLQQAEALRQSILKRAFSGMLVPQDANDEPAAKLLASIKAERETQSVQKNRKTTIKAEAPKTNVIPFPAKVIGISPSELHAGIMALAYQQHEKNRRSWYFGHVKAEKISHMVEAHLGIDLDRQPIQDAAGPNDFKRLLFVESLAREQKWFDVRKQKSGRHVLHKMEGFDELISRTSAALDEHLDSVLELIGHFIGWDKTRSEIMVTLYAAWNNLIILGQKPTDEEIVTKAYEDWHPDKTKIRRERFFKCLGWMRTHHFVPLGKGKYVAKK
jgi:type I restriction enzyme, S subunit